MPDRPQLAVATCRPSPLRTFLLAVAIMSVAAPAAGQVACGGTVGPGGTFTMTGDILACASDPALRVVGKVVLDMAGHRLSCAPGGAFVVGISIEGKDATLRNGSVENCTFGIGVFGLGRHTVRDVTVYRGLVGIAVTTDRNKLLRNGVHDTSANGFSVSGSDNVLNGNAVVASPTGFLIQGLRNSFIGNVASDNDAGFEASGSGDTLLEQNIAEGNDTGFRVGDASSNVKLRRNVATGSDDGFVIGGSGHAVVKNTAVNSRFAGFRTAAGAGGHLLRDNLAIGTKNFDSSRGFLIAEADGNTVEANRAFNAFLEGIAVSSQSNVIRDSLALGNGPDLNDFNAGCADNVWSNNLGEKVQSCMD